MSNLNVDEQVTVFNRTILNILKNSIPYEAIVCDDNDPLWFNKKIKSLIPEGTLLLETFWKNRENVEIITCLNNLNDRLALLINTAKQNYYSKIVEKLQILREALKHTGLYSKSFWIIKKIPIIPPLYHKNEFVIDINKKIELFNSFFADQCSLISNSSELPSKLEYLIQSRLSSITFYTDDIAKMIQNLDPNKAHGHDQISIRMPSLIIFNQYLKKGTFPNAWKKAMLFRLQKRR